MNRQTVENRYADKMQKNFVRVLSAPTNLCKAHACVRASLADEKSGALCATTEIRVRDACFYFLIHSNSTAVSRTWLRTACAEPLVSERERAGGGHSTLTAVCS